MAAAPHPRRIALLAFSGTQALDLIGPLEVFTGATQIKPGAYTVDVIAPTGEPFPTSSGLALTPTVSVSDWRGSIDTLVVTGGPGVTEAARDDQLMGWLGAAAGRARRVASVCNGAFLLAEAGLLDGRRATTHWAQCAELSRRYPGIIVEDDPIFVRDGNVWTSAGVTSGMDLALALVEADLGRAVALKIARWLVLFTQRPGGQAQFSAHLTAQRADRKPLQEVQVWIIDNLAADLTVEALAGRAAMSPRNFARAFRREVGQTPAVFVENTRVEAARQALVDSHATLDAVATRCGFGCAETMRRAFHRVLGVGPADYRARFRPALSDIA